MNEIFVEIIFPYKFRNCTFSTKKSILINSYIYMEKSSPKKFVLIVIPIFPYQRTGSNMKRNPLSYQIIFKTIKF